MTADHRPQFPPIGPREPSGRPGTTQFALGLAICAIFVAMQWRGGGLGLFLLSPLYLPLMGVHLALLWDGLRRPLDADCIRWSLRINGLFAAGLLLQIDTFGEVYWFMPTGWPTPLPPGQEGQYFIAWNLLVMVPAALAWRALRRCRSSRATQAGIAGTGMAPDASTADRPSRRPWHLAAGLAISAVFSLWGTSQIVSRLSSVAHAGYLVVPAIHLVVLWIGLRPPRDQTCGGWGLLANGLLAIGWLLQRDFGPRGLDDTVGAWLFGWVNQAAENQSFTVQDDLMPTLLLWNFLAVAPTALAWVALLGCRRGQRARSA